jgi:hypothetical protein
MPAGLSQALRQKMPELHDPETTGVPIIKGFCLKLYYVLGLRPLGTLGYFKFHRLFFRQGVKALALDGAVMHEDIGAFFPGDEAKPLGVVKPFYRTSFLHCETSCRYCNDIPPKKQGAQQVR